MTRSPLRLPISIIAGGRDVAALSSGIRGSNVAPGGFETCSFQPDTIRDLKAGTQVRVWLGGETLWHGYVNEPGQDTQQGHDVASINAVGYGMLAKDYNYSENYIDRDMSAFEEPGYVRQEAHITNARNLVHAWKPMNQVTDGVTGLSGTIEGPVPAATWCETVKNYGETLIGPVRIYALEGVGISLADGNAFFLCDFNVDGTFVPERYFHIITSTYPLTINPLTTPGYGGSAGEGLYWLSFLWLHSAGLGVADTNYGFRLRGVSIQGRHGLPIIGNDFRTDGLRTSDICLDALARVNSSGRGIQIRRGRIDEPGYAVTHYTFHDQRKSAEQVWEDMIKLNGYSYGVWEPQGMFSDEPTFWHNAPPTDATAVIYRTDCDEFNAPRTRLDAMHSKANVTYNNGFGLRNVTVTVENPLLSQAGLGDRTLELDMGVGNAARAQEYGQAVLLLSQRSQRGAGSLTIRGDVRLPGGGTKPAALLKAGRDRIRIPDIPDGGSFTTQDTRRYDTFMVRRVEWTLGDGGDLVTRVDFDGGNDLLEVLNARVASELSVLTA